MDTATTPETGTLIHGTLLECDLIPAFLDALQQFDPKAAETIIDEFGRSFIDRLSKADGLDYPSVGEMDRRGWLMEALLDALDTVGPDGTYFGTHPGDGSDFGWWATDEAV